MVAGLRGWERSPLRRDGTVGAIAHDGWSVEARRAPLGVVAFVFEGRPNVFADAAGVVRTRQHGRDAHRFGRARHRRGDRRARRRAGVGGGGLPAGHHHARALAVTGRRVGAVRRPRDRPRRRPRLGRRGRPARRRRPAGGNTGERCTAPAAPGSSPASAPTPSGSPPSVTQLARPQGVQHAQRLLHPVRAGGRARAAVPRRARRCRRVSARPPGSTSTPRRRPVVPAERFTTKVTIRRADGDRIEPAATLLDRDELGTEWEWEGSPEVVARRHRVRRRGGRPAQPLQPAVHRLADQRRPRRAGALLRRRRRPVRRRRLHPLGRRPVRPRHPRARPVELAVRPPARPRRRALRRLDPHRSATAPRSTTPPSTAEPRSTPVRASRTSSRPRPRRAARRRGRATASARSARAAAAATRRTPSQRSGSGSHRRERWPTHGSRVRSVSRPRIRSASVRPARFAVATPSPT